MHTSKNRNICLCLCLCLCLLNSKTKQKQKQKQQNRKKTRTEAHLRKLRQHRVLPWFTPEGLTDETQVVDSHNGIAHSYRNKICLQALSSKKTTTEHRKSGWRMKRISKSGKSRPYRPGIDVSSLPTGWRRLPNVFGSEEHALPADWLVSHRVWYVD